jgi:exosome complex RNA-binding protein Csl4
MATRWLEFELDTGSAVLRQFDLVLGTVQQVTLPSAMVPVVVVVDRHTCTVRQAIQIQLLHRMIY